MTAGNLPVKKVKTKQKIVAAEGGNVRLAANGNVQLAQIDVYTGRVR